MDRTRAQAPVDETSISANDDMVTPWEEGRRILAEAGTYWLSTVGPDGRLHVRPHFAVWVDDTLFFTSNLAAHKARNLATDPRCTIAAQNGGLDLVLEGEAQRENDEATVRRVADAYIAKYGWPVTVVDGAFDAPYGAPTAGQPPYHVFRVIPAAIYGFGNGPATRWRFTHGPGDRP